ncbi:flagellar FliJ family protein [Candidatus Marinarcus aquaticus]|uniref:Flagellar FliJ protein n=1 Tax=Candidatus Marinarcus aquaticus TaxID=2044504 RepID=A0A4Q0XP54_9BACT|nr:flagellar FliJ family protein [Candidatus Marinarcus aquaticus]RXJ56370.1 hypothetical protein CRV04_08110 [Candidatus Marinarcus aquaticus]
MITKIYNLKKNQTDQKILQRARVQNKIEELSAEILMTQTKLETTSVDKFGAISDFAILQIHKNTMKAHIGKLNMVKNRLEQEVEKIDEEIKELLKETEQFKYLVEEEKKEAFKKLLKKEEEFTEEYVQSKYIAS